MTAIAEPPRTFTSLPRASYTSPEIFEREVDRVYSRQWILFSHISEIAEPGHMLVRNLGIESVIVTRDQAGELRAFLNVCRHRGSQICDSGKFKARRIVCPYHSWSYTLDGRLAGSPAMKNGVDLDYSEYGLHSVHLNVWHGFVFVAVGEEPPRMSITEALGPAAEFVNVYDTENLRPAHQKVYPVECNWKLLIENFLECYHCIGAHPELSAISDIPATFAALETMSAADLGPPSEYLYSSVPVVEGVRSHTLDGQPASLKPLGRAYELDSLPPTAAIAQTPIISSIQVYADYAVTHRLLPVSVDRSVMICDWFVHADAVEGVDYTLDRLLPLWEATNAQDVELSERNQRGVNSRRYTPGPNSNAREPAIRSSLAVYHDLMGEADAYESLVGSRPDS